MKHTSFEDSAFCVIVSLTPCNFASIFESMITVKVLDETAPLEAVILGTAESMGGEPKLEETYDPKSKEHILAGTFPKEANLKAEMTEVSKVLEKHGVKVYRPESIPGFCQGHCFCDR